MKPTIKKQLGVVHKLRNHFWGTPYFCENTQPFGPLCLLAMFSPKFIRGDSPIMDAYNKTYVLRRGQRFFPEGVKKAIRGCDSPADTDLKNTIIIIYGDIRHGL